MSPLLVNVVSLLIREKRISIAFYTNAVTATHNVEIGEKRKLVSEFSLAGQKQNLKKLRVISRTRSVFSTVSFRKLVVPLSVLSLNQDIKIWLIMLCNFDM